MQIAVGAAGQQHGRGDGAGAGHERDRQREGGDVAHVLFDRLLGGFAFAAHAHAEQHLEGDREQQQAAGDAKRGQRDAERAEQPVADQRGADEDGAGDQAGTQRDAAARGAGQAVGDRQKGRRQADRIDHDEQRQQRGYGEVERHDRACD